MGFDAAERRKKMAGMGLLTIQESLGVLGGRLELVSRSGAGCRARVVLPVPKK